ncbi:MAG: T9SS C-terminal target domain-containing protein, partial [Flavobacteriales bacterium]
MKKILPTLSLVFSGSLLFSQNTAPSVLSIETSPPQVTAQQETSAARTQATIIWSEDFANGIPSTWTNLGQRANGNLYPNSVWEYRGPLTNPNSNVGSRGGYGAPGTPINSPTRANGFMIFDSDYLDNGGVAGNFGLGSAPTPHIGRLTTETIDLSNHPFVKLEFNYYLRNFASRFGVAISVNNGGSWLDTVYFGTTIGVNESSAINAKAEFDISAIAGGQSQVQLRFVYDGTPTQGSNTGYYFCQIDDIKITELPAHRLVPFTDSEGIRFDVWNNNPSEMRHGYVSTRQNRSFRFGANFLNFGTSAQTNARLEVDVYNGASLIQTLQSAPFGALASGDTARIAQTTTNAFLPPSPGVYTAAYRIVSDSIPIADAEKDTIVFVVSPNQTGQHFPYFSNTIGTPQLGNLGRVSSQFRLVNQEVVLGAIAGIANTTNTGGRLIFKLHTASPLTNPIPLAIDTVTITAAHVAAQAVTATFSNAPILPAGTHYLTVEFDGGTSTINLINDARVWAPPLANLMYLTSQPGWYTGYQNSRQFNIPHLRIIGCNDTATGACQNFATLSAFQSVCATDPAFPLTGGMPAGGTYSGPGVSAGQFDPSIPGAGSHTITYTVNINGNPQSATQTIEVKASPNLNLPTSPVAVCSGGNPVSLFPFVQPGGGTFSGTGITTGNLFDPNVAGGGIQTISYEYTDPDGCTNTGTFSVNVVAPPTVNITNTVSSFCIYNDTVTLSGTPTGGNFSGPGVIGNQFVPALAGIGTHPVVYSFTDGNGCEGSDLLMVDVDSCLSILSFGQKITIEVFPNPSTGIFTLKGVDENADVVIRNALGQEINAEISRRGELNIDLSNQPAGIYFIRV